MSGDDKAVRLFWLSAVGLLAADSMHRGEEYFLGACIALAMAKLFGCYDLEPR